MQLRVAVLLKRVKFTEGRSSSDAWMGVSRELIQGELSSELVDRGHLCCD